MRMYASQMPCLPILNLVLLEWASWLSIRGTAARTSSSLSVDSLVRPLERITWLLHYVYTMSRFAGAGKTTLATKLGEKMGLPVFHEPVIDNVYLTDFYRDPARYSFPLQVRGGWREESPTLQKHWPNIGMQSLLWHTCLAACCKHELPQS